MKVLQGLVREIRPLPTVAAITAGVTGMAFGGNLSGWGAYALLLGAVLYLAHTKDAYVDYYVRGEDRMYPWGSAPATGELISPRGMAVMAGAAVLVAVAVPATVLAGEPPAFYALVLGMVVLAASYAGRLDLFPLGSALSYPVGVGLATVAGAVLAAGRVGPGVLVYAGSLVVVLAGAKVVEDLIDADHDREMGKRTVPVVLGRDGARELGYGLVAVGLASVALVWPTVAPWVLVGLGAAVVSVRLEVDRGIYVLVAGVYVVMVGVLLRAWLGPF